MINSKFRKAFTLIELLVVIAIIGILAGLVTASLGNARKKAFNSEVMADLQTIKTAEALYASDHDGAYTTNLNDLVPDYMPTAAKTDGDGNAYSIATVGADGYRATGKLKNVGNLQATLSNQASGGTGIYKDSSNNFFFQVSGN